MTPRKAPEAVLVALAEASLEVDRIAGRAAVYGGGDLGNALQALHRAQDSYRAAVAPLRTRAEVDASKLLLADDLHKRVCDVKWFHEEYARLCSEPTADETGPVTAEPCGCEETDALHGKIARALLIAAKWHRFGDSAARSFADEITKALTDD